MGNTQASQNTKDTQAQPISLDCLPRSKSVTTQKPDATTSLIRNQVRRSYREALRPQSSIDSFEIKKNLRKNFGKKSGNKFNIKCILKKSSGFGANEGSYKKFDFESCSPKLARKLSV